MEHMRISGTEPSSVILSRKKLTLYHVEKYENSISDAVKIKSNQLHDLFMHLTNLIYKVNA